jgi:hypothetical protein
MREPQQGRNWDSKRATYRLAAKNMPPHEVTMRRAINDDIGAISAVMPESSSYEGQYRSILEGYELTSAQIERDVVPRKTAYQRHSAANTN